MTTLKTQKNQADPKAFIEKVAQAGRRQDSFTLLQLLEEITGEPPVMWGPSIIGFGTMAYSNTTGDHEWMAIGFSPRKQNLTVYIMDGFKRYDDFLKKLGKYSLGKSCLYIKRLDDIDHEVLKDLLKASYTNIINKGEISY